ncbi:unnamed protein product [Ixodes persulcatus]
MMRQTALLAAGCQPWHINVVSFSGQRFAYAATLAVYIYEMDSFSGEFRLHSIMAEHQRTITGLDWHPTREDWLASGSLDPKLCVWDVSKHLLVAVLSEPACPPSLLSWKPDVADVLVYLAGRGPLHAWTVPGGESRKETGREPQFASTVTQMTWHPHVAGKVAYGHQDGSISVLQHGGSQQKHIRLLNDNPPDDDEADPRIVVALRWDTLSTSYLLAALPSGHLFLLDTSADTVQVVTSYSCPSRATTIRMVSWVPGAAGMFVTGGNLLFAAAADAGSGTLRVWNVSRDAPLENIQVHGSGFHTLCACPGFAVHGRDDGSGGQGDQTTRLPHHVRVICLFRDGGIGLYNVRKRSWDFLRDTAHTETIFDCQFKPDDCNLLATGSYDGTLKIWNIETMTPVLSSPPCRSTIYCVSWAPAGQDCLALGTSRDGVLIWDSAKNVARATFLDHGKHTAIYCVAWNQTDSKKVASAGADGTCMIHQVDGTLVQTFHHPGIVFGCDWNPSNENIVATACEDSLVRIFYLSMNGGVPLKTLAGHTSKVFRVKWSPLRDGVLCSTSDDRTIQVWNYTCESAVRILRGHGDFTRSVVWSPELSHLLLSGSWDATIRLWDTRDGSCLCLLWDHGADIYGLACHPRRPFIVASSSRDSTVRIWSMLPMASTLFLKVLAGWDVDSIVAAQGELPSGRGKEMLCGSVARNLKHTHKSSRDDAALRAWTTFFCGTRGVNHLWDLLAVAEAPDTAVVSDTYRHSALLHRSHLAKFRASRAHELELVKASRFGSGGGGIGGPSRDASLQQAAQLYLSVGNLQKYCEVLTELGSWNEALSLAPGVSYQYWRQLTKRRADALVQQDHIEAVGLHLALGDISAITEFLCNRGQAQEAYVMALAADDRLRQHFQPDPGSWEPQSTKEDEQDSVRSLDGLVRDCAQNMSDKYLAEGAPVLAACCHLANNDIESTVRTLVQGNELELALSVALRGGGPAVNAQHVASWLAWRCCAVGNWYLAMDVLSLCDDAHSARVEILAGCGCSLAERNALHEKASDVVSR